MDGMVRRSRVAVIPARGGSKRLPHKNIMEFGGRAMLAWTVDAARGAGIFDRVIVSTEDAEIARVATEAGAEVPFLRQGLHDDFTPVSEVTVSVIRQIRQVLGEDYETVVQLMANCPLRDAADIRAASAAFEGSGAPFQISCARFGWLNPWWAFKCDAEGRGEWIHPDVTRSRSQDLPPLFGPTGAIWIARVTALESAGTFYGPGHRFEPLDWAHAIDIDDADDLRLARALLHVRDPVTSG
jgi:CMP-N-acetylneuraminic acid synthetase